jgi:hypothetical protein
MSPVHQKVLAVCLAAGLAKVIQTRGAKTSTMAKELEDQLRALGYIR